MPHIRVTRTIAGRWSVSDAKAIKKAALTTGALASFEMIVYGEWEHAGVVMEVAPRPVLGFSPVGVRIPHASKAGESVLLRPTDGSMLYTRLVLEGESPYAPDTLLPEGVKGLLKHDREEDAPPEPTEDLGPEAAAIAEAADAEHLGLGFSAADLRGEED